MFDAGSAIDNAAAGSGFMAASVAVGGFVAHARPALRGEADHELRYATVVGGVCGLVVAILLIVGSVMASIVLSAVG